MNKILLNKTYYAEDICDIDRDVSECYEDEIPGASYDEEAGWPKGKFVVTVTYIED